MARTTPVHSGYTIINGSGTGSNGGRIDVWVEYRLGTQSVTGNYTPVIAYFYAALNPSYSSTTSNARGLNSSFSVDGVAGSGISNGAYDFTSSSKVNLLGSFSGNIAHNPGGTKTVKFAGSFTTLSSYISGGSVSATVTLPTIAQNFTPPTVSGAVEDSNPATLALTGNKHVFVRGVSNALCTITATPASGATITKKTIGGSLVTGNSHTIAGIQTASLVFAATDSRGSTGQYTAQLSMLPYVLLTCNPSVKRTTPTGSQAVLTIRGQCWKGSFGAASNTLTVTCKINGQTFTLHPEIAQDNSYSAQLTIEDLEYTQAYALEITAEDALRTVTKALTVQKGQPVFDWGEKDFQFHVPVTGDFRGTLQGLHARTVWVCSTRSITVQSLFSDFSGQGESRQSIFLFGFDNLQLITGVAGIRNNADTYWSGTDGVTVTALTDGKFTIKLPTDAYDWFTLLSAEPFEIV